MVPTRIRVLITPLLGIVGQKIDLATFRGGGGVTDAPKSLIMK